MENQPWEELQVELLWPLKQGLQELGFDTMTPVQAACIPPFLSHKDVAAEAVTGSGKTLAFLIPLVQILLKRETPLKKYDVGALVVLPTRELATQIYEVLQTFLQFTSFTSALFLGGKSVSSDLSSFMSDGAHIVVSTPGRLMDLLARKVDEGPALSAGLKFLDVFILDEADRLLDSGFSSTLNTILAYLPKLRRTGIFSATQTSDVTSLIRAGMRNPVQVRVKDKGASHFKTPASLHNFYMVTEAQTKIGVLVELLRRRKEEKTLVFFSTCACVEFFYEVLRRAVCKEDKENLLCLHGKMKQKRFKIFDKFRDMTRGALLCTDVLCRGVDIPFVDWVIQFDPPSSAVSFVHRCGRTARNGKEGSALLMLLPNETEYVRFIELNQKVGLNPVDPPREFPDLLQSMREMQLEDRALMDKANRAFASHIQAYTKHECSLLINVKRLNFQKLATGFGLLRMLRMPELKKQKNPNAAQDFSPCDIDFNSVPYKDAHKEEERQKNLSIYRETGRWPGAKGHRGKTEAWSRTKGKSDRKKERKEKKDRAVTRNRFSEEDLKDLDEDFRMLKKFKQGKVSDRKMEEYFECQVEET